MSQDQDAERSVRLPRGIPRLADGVVVPRLLRPGLRVLSTEKASEVSTPAFQTDVWTTRVAVMVFGTTLVTTLVVEAMLVLSNRPLVLELFLGLPPATLVVCAVVFSATHDWLPLPHR